jgi:predicted Na+-dependent transporter
MPELKILIHGLVINLIWSAEVRSKVWESVKVVLVSIVKLLLTINFTYSVNRLFAFLPNEVTYERACQKYQ